MSNYVLTNNMFLKSLLKKVRIFYSDLMDTLYLIDSHDHSEGKGVKIPGTAIASDSIFNDKLNVNAQISGYKINAFFNYPLSFYGGFTFNGKTNSGIDIEPLLESFQLKLPSAMPLDNSYLYINSNKELGTIPIEEFNTPIVNKQLSNLNTSISISSPLLPELDNDISIEVNSTSEENSTMSCSNIINSDGLVVDSSNELLLKDSISINNVLYKPLICETLDIDEALLQATYPSGNRFPIPLAISSSSPKELISATCYRNSESPSNERRLRVSGQSSYKNFNALTSGEGQAWREVPFTLDSYKHSKVLPKINNIYLYPTGVWSSYGVYPINICFCSGYSIEGNSSSYGGFLNHGGSSTVSGASLDSCNIIDDTGWVSRASSPYAIKQHNLSSTFSTGGYRTSLSASTSLTSIYDLNLDTWGYGVSLPEARYGHSSLGSGNSSVKVMGGVVSGAFSVTCRDFNGVSWSNSTSFPVFSSYSGAASQSNTGYASSGDLSNGVLVKPHNSSVASNGVVCNWDGVSWSVGIDAPINTYSGASIIGNPDQMLLVAMVSGNNLAYRWDTISWCQESSPLVDSENYGCSKGNGNGSFLGYYVGGYIGITVSPATSRYLQTYLPSSFTEDEVYKLEIVMKELS